MRYWKRLFFLPYSTVVKTIGSFNHELDDNKRFYKYECVILNLTFSNYSDNNTDFIIIKKSGVCRCSTISLCDFSLLDFDYLNTRFVCKLMREMLSRGVLNGYLTKSHYLSIKAYPRSIIYAMIHCTVKTSLAGLPSSQSSA